MSLSVQVSGEDHTWTEVDKRLIIGWCITVNNYCELPFSEINDNRSRWLRRVIISIRGEVDNGRNYSHCTSVVPEDPASHNEPTAAFGEEPLEISLRQTRTSPGIEPQKSIEGGLEVSRWLLECLDGWQWI